MAYTLKKRLKRMAISAYQKLTIDKLLMKAGFFNIAIDRAIEKFYKPEYGSKKLLKKDIKDCYINYLTTPDEYFLLDFYGKDSRYKASFLTDKKRIRYLIKNIGEEKFINDLCDKYHFYELTSAFFKREVLCVGGKHCCAFEDFERFVKKHDSIFVKPLSDSYGRGAHLFPYCEGSLRELYQKYSSKGSWIMEEKIIQVKELSEWNESSVNTVRLPCFLYNGEFNVLNPFFRTGRAGSVIDNAGGGGIFACLDEESGYVVSRGINENNEYFESHPDSGKIFMGWSVPKWEELILLAERIFRECFPNHKYIGFDFALTNQGWVLIEGNWGQFVGQYASKKGVKQQFINYIGDKK